MRIYCTTEAANAMLGIARQMGLQLHEWDNVRQPTRGKFAGHEAAVKLLLRPRAGEEDADLYRASRHGRRLWAASWAGHYVFMRAVLEIDPDAVIHTSHATYHGLEGFDSYAIYTASRNVGSMVHPVSYREAQAPGHVDWDWEEDLASRALMIVAAL